MAKKQDEPKQDTIYNPPILKNVTVVGSLADYAMAYLTELAKVDDRFKLESKDSILIVALDSSKSKELTSKKLMKLVEDSKSKDYNKRYLYTPTPDKEDYASEVHIQSIIDYMQLKDFEFIDDLARAYRRVRQGVTSVNKTMA